jgi:hypothetical protein
MSEEMQNQTLNRNMGVSRKAGLTMPCSYHLKKLHPWINEFNKKHFSRFNEQKNKTEIRGVSSSKYPVIFACAVFENIGRVLAEESLRHWASNMNSSNRINFIDIHSMITNPDNCELNSIFPFSSLERARDVTTLERKLHEMNRKKKDKKTVDDVEYQSVVDKLREKSPLNLIDGENMTTFKFYYDARKVKKIMKDIYENIEVHTHKNNEPCVEVQTEENVGDEKDEKCIMTINDNVRVYLNVLLEDLIIRFLKTLTNIVTHTCSSKESLNNFTKARKKADEIHFRIVFETLLDGKLFNDCMDFGEKSLENFKQYETANKIAKAEAIANGTAKPTPFSSTERKKRADAMAEAEAEAVAEAEAEAKRKKDLNSNSTDEKKVKKKKKDKKEKK